MIALFWSHNILLFPLIIIKIPEIHKMSVEIKLTSLIYLVSLVRIPLFEFAFTFEIFAFTSFLFLFLTFELYSSTSKDNETVKRTSFSKYTIYAAIIVWNYILLMILSNIHLFQRILDFIPPFIK